MVTRVERTSSRGAEAAEALGLSRCLPGASRHLSEAGNAFTEQRRAARLQGDAVGDRVEEEDVRDDVRLKSMSG